MLFRLPLVYEVTGTPKGRKNETTESFWEYVEIDIPVIADENAPIAVIWDDRLPETPMEYMRDRDNWHSLQRVPEDGMQMMRFKDGEFYLRRPDRMTPDDLANNLTPKDDIRIFGQDFVPYNIRETEHPAEGTPYRQDKEYSSTFDAKLANLRAAAEKFFIVGDDIFSLSSEPVVIKISYRAEKCVAVAPRVVPSNRLDVKTPRFRLDKYEEVVDSCNKIVLTFQERELVTLDRAPTIYLDQAINFDDLSANLVNSVRTYIDGYSDNVRLRGVDPDLGIAFLNLKKALIHYDATGDLDLLEKYAGLIVEKFPGEFEYNNVATSFQDYADRQIDISTGPFRKPK